MIPGLTRLIFLIPLLSFLSIPQGRSQTTLTKIKEWQVKEVANVSVDRLGNFFVVFKKGGIKKYDPDGKVIATLRKAKPTLLEPWYHPAIFVYNRADQTYLSYGRFFENVQEKKLPPEYAIEPYLVCPTHDNRLWILDKADYSLKKVNPLSYEVLNEFSIPVNGSTPEFSYLREYQNLIFLKENNTIWIINTLGKVIHQIKSDPEANFGFFGQEIYYLKKNTIHFFDLLTEARYEIALQGSVKYVVVTDERILTVSPDNKITLYIYTP